MNNLLATAVKNNALWCDLVCRLHKNPGEFTKDLWINTKKVPKYYPNIITLTKIADNTPVLESLYDILDKNTELFVKDSFAELNLSDLNYEKIIEAEWIGMEPGRIDWNSSRWQRVHFPTRMNLWLKMWEEKNPIESEIFSPEILKNENVWFCGTFEEGGFKSGAILFLEENTVGISNIFSAVPVDEDFWKQLLAYIGVQFPGRQIVGYQSGAELKSAVSAGFEALGRLTVWKK